MKSIRTYNCLSVSRTVESWRISSFLSVPLFPSLILDFLSFVVFPVASRRFILFVFCARKAVFILWARRRIGTMLRRLSEVVCRPIRIMVCLCWLHLGVPRRLIQGRIKELRNILRDTETNVKRMKINVQPRLKSRSRNELQI